MKRKAHIVAALVIMGAAASLLIIQSAMAKGTPFQAGYDHGCSDAKLPFSARYINQPGKGPSFHTQEFMAGYNAGFKACTGSGSSKGTPFQAGYDHGCSDAKLPFSARYINQPGKGPSFHTQEFMAGYNAGFKACTGSGS